MLLLAILSLLLLTALVMGLIHLFSPGFAYHWLVAAIGGLLTWPLTLALRFQPAKVIPLIHWQPEALFPSSPALLIDVVSWGYAFALATLVLAVILTDVARAAESDWRVWSGVLAVGALGILAVCAENPLTLLLAWAALDLVEVLFLMGQVQDSSERAKVVVAFAARAGGLLWLLWADLSARAGGGRLAFQEFPASAGIYLLLAAGLRLGVLPLHLTYLKEIPLRRGMGTILRLAPAAASLVLLTRTAFLGLISPYAPILLLLSGLAALYSSAAWALAKDELDGRPFWLLAFASFSVAAAVLSMPGASLAWGLAALFSGGLIFLTSADHPRLIPLAFLGLIGFSSLPYTPAWEGAGLFDFRGGFLAASSFLLSLVFLLAGYVRHVLIMEAHEKDLERWVWLIYPFGLVLLPLSHFLASPWSSVSAGLPANPALDLGDPRWWAGFLALGLAGLLWMLSRNLSSVFQRVAMVWNSVFSLNWLYRVLWKLYGILGRAAAILTGVLEGEGGILWALALLVLLLSWLSIIQAGG